MRGARLRAPHACGLRLVSAGTRIYVTLRCTSTCAYMKRCAFYRIIVTMAGQTLRTKSAT